MEKACTRKTWSTGNSGRYLAELAREVPALPPERSLPLPSSLLCSQTCGAGSARQGGVVRAGVKEGATVCGQVLLPNTFCYPCKMYSLCFSLYLVSWDR